MYLPDLCTERCHTKTSRARYARMDKILHCSSNFRSFVHEVNQARRELNWQSVKRRSKENTTDLFYKELSALTYTYLIYIQRSKEDATQVLVARNQRILQGYKNWQIQGNQFHVQMLDAYWDLLKLVLATWKHTCLDSKRLARRMYKSRKCPAE